ncbi:MAG TPA: porphobilinogen synthase, partial [candidate division Zixibacteria bacterium]|nr:porphobilinogen synthase [candidate division Zixibacteria bacterium]
MRSSEAMRSLVRETRLSPEGFIYPLFVCPGEGIRKEVGSMPGVFNLSVDEAVKEAAEAKALGIPALILFGLPDKKDEIATGAWADDGIVQVATRAIKATVPDLIVMGDVCLCEYMSHGHCGIVKKVK